VYGVIYKIAKFIAKTFEARQGDIYTVGANTHNQGAFVPDGATADTCVACVRGETQMVTFAGIPEDVRREYHIPVVATGRFIEIDNHDFRLARDMVDFGTDHGQIDFVRLKGAHAHIGAVATHHDGYHKLLRHAGIAFMPSAQVAEKLALAAQ
jgi:hypothetical protein